MRKEFSRLALSARPHKEASGKPTRSPDGTGPSRSQPDHAGVPKDEDTNTAPQHHPDPVDPVNPPPERDPARTLEDLPAELRRLILSQLATDDVNDLRALVAASPVFYQQYLHDRKTLLRSILKRARGIPIAEAYALQLSTSLYSKQPDADSPSELADPGAIRSFIDTYRSLRQLPADEILAQRCTDGDLVGMAAFYEAVARPLVTVFAGRFLRRLKPAPELGIVSTVEEIRLLRGMYRYQIYCNLFGQGREGQRKVPELAFKGEQLDLFFLPFKPWEIEEIYCVYVLVRDTYGWVMDKTEIGLNGGRLGFEEWEAPVEGAMRDMRNAPHRCSLLQGAALRGLVPFYRLVREEEDDEKVAGVLESYLVDGSGNIEHALGRPNQAARRRRLPTDEDGIEAAWEKLKFDGDLEDGPPLAWIVYWKDRYINRYGDALEPTVQRWGHVFWDYRRLVLSQGLEELMSKREVFRRW